MTGPTPALRFRVPGLPIPEGSLKGFAVAGRVRLVHDNEKQLKRWRGDVAKAAQVALMEDPAWRPLVGPVRLSVVFAFARPLSHPKGRTTWPTGQGTTGDVDKLARAILDALKPPKSGEHVSVWRDDAQVVDLHAVKDWCGQGPAGALTLPGAIVRIWRAGTEPHTSGQIPLLAEQDPRA